MRFVTFRTEDGHEHIGVVRDSSIVDLTLWLSAGKGGEHSHPDMVDFVATGEVGLRRATEALEASAEELDRMKALVPLSEDVLLAPITRPRKNIICMGRNYSEHAAESVRAFGEAPLPKERPEYINMFTKSTTSMNGPYGDIPYDARVSSQIDWEVELAVVIGMGGSNVAANDAMQHVFGYMVLNDISARDIQKRHANQYFKGKSLDGTCPTGPWIVTADELRDPSDLELWLRVNGVEKQHDRTGSMLFSIPEIIEQVAIGMTLEPGDIIATGTPAGIGMARTPPEYLKPGDVVECEIEKIGTIRNHVVQA